MRASLTFWAVIAIVLGYNAFSYAKPFQEGDRVAASVICRNPEPLLETSREIAKPNPDQAVLDEIEAKAKADLVCVTANEPVVVHLVAKLSSTIMDHGGYERPFSVFRVKLVAVPEAPDFFILLQTDAPKKIRNA